MHQCCFVICVTLGDAIWAGIKKNILIWSGSNVNIYKSNQIYIYIVLRTSSDISKCFTETHSKTSNSKQCRCRSTVARKNTLERPKPRKKPREEPGYEGLPVLFWLCLVEIITEDGQHFHKWPAWSNNNNLHIGSCPMGDIPQYGHRHNWLGKY